MAGVVAIGLIVAGLAGYLSRTGRALWLEFGPFKLHLAGSEPQGHKSPAQHGERASRR